MMPDKSEMPAPEGTGTQLAKAATEFSGVAVSSQQVSWWSVHEFVSPLLTAVGTWPMIGSPAWCDLASDDPRKIAAVFNAARHWALRVETCQEQRAEASHAVAASADWSAIARSSFRRDCAIAHGSYYIPRVAL